MFAAFGSISFQVLASPTKLDVEKKYRYESINVIGSSPILQWIYDDLRHVEMSITLHQLWCNPQRAIQALQQLGDAHVPRQFVFGNKQSLGTYVISQSRLKHTWLADDGTVIAAEMDLELTEYIAPYGQSTALSTSSNPPAVKSSTDAASGLTLVQSPATSDNVNGIPYAPNYTDISGNEIARWG